MNQQQQQLQRYGLFIYSEVVLILLASLNPAWHVRFEDVRSQEVIISFVGLGTIELGLASGWGYSKSEFARPIGQFRILTVGLDLAWSGD